MHGNNSKISSKNNNDVAFVRYSLYSGGAQTHETTVKAEYPNVFAVVNMVTPHDGVSAVLHPDTSESITADLVVFVLPLCALRHNQANILTVRDLAFADYGLSTDARHAHGRAN